MSVFAGPWIAGLSRSNPVTNAAQILSLWKNATDGNYWYKPSGETTPIRCYTNFSNAPAGKGYVLVARGRESTDWWNTNGQNYTTGLTSEFNTTNTPIAVAPNSFVNNLIGGNFNAMKMLVNRINRGDSWYFQGSTSTTFSWTYFQQSGSSVAALSTQYSGAYKAGSTLMNWPSNIYWTDTLNYGGGNNCDRTFTWSWGGHGPYQGWSGGNDCIPSGGFQYATEGHSIQLVNCFIEC
jgi:hypothetical protein